MSALYASEPTKTHFLTHFWPMFPFYPPLKHQKTFDFLVFSGGIKWEHWPEMGQTFQCLFFLNNDVTCTCNNKALLFEKNLCKTLLRTIWILYHIVLHCISVNIFLFKVRNRNTRKWCELCSELKIKTLERRRLQLFIFLTLNK